MDLSCDERAQSGISPPTPGPLCLSPLSRSLWRLMMCFPPVILPFPEGPAHGTTRHWHLALTDHVAVAFTPLQFYCFVLSWFIHDPPPPPPCCRLSARRGSPAIWLEVDPLSTSWLPVWSVTLSPPRPSASRFFPPRSCPNPAFTAVHWSYSASS